MSRNRGERKTAQIASFYALIVLVVLADQLTKYLAVVFLSSHPSVSVIPGIFHLTLVHNTGIAFGLFRDHETALLVLITISLIGLFCWSYFFQHRSRLSKVAIDLILAGAIGNWIDRVRVGAVIDFFDFRIWPVFNIADSAITIGVCLYLWDLLFSPSVAEK